ncbi:MAG: HAD family phosphatase [Lachnospiraceae bacterium]|nr:HAD family phosphatase [Lachnospiraceae bacterium]
MKYKLLATDLDGTLVTEDKRVTERTKQAVKAMISRGGTLVLSSGRPSYGVWHVAKELELPELGGYILSYNGGELLDCKSGKAEFSVQIPPDKIPEIIHLAREHKTAILTYEEEYIISENGDDLYVLGEARNTRMKVKEVPDLISYVTFPIVKMMMVGTEEQILKLEPVVRKALGPEFSVFRSEAYHLEILPAGVDKGSGLLKTLEYLGISREETISCGDYDNDIPMNEAAGLGVAMENGCPAIREKADYITCSNEADGVAVVIEKFVLGEEGS